MGGTGGAGFGIAAVISIPGGLDILTIPVTTMAGFAFGVFGAGMGVIVGSIKDRMPLNTDPLKFEKYKGSLQGGSLSSHLKYKEGGSRQVHILHVSLGVAYHFSGRSL